VIVLAGICVTVASSILYSADETTPKAGPEQGECSDWRQAKRCDDPGLDPVAFESYEHASDAAHVLLSDFHRYVCMSAGPIRQRLCGAVLYIHLLSMGPSMAGRAV
jgi:hypothetical protein